MEEGAAEEAEGYQERDRGGKYPQFCGSGERYEGE